MRTRRLHFCWLHRNRAILNQAMWLGAFASAFMVAACPLLAQGPPGAVAAASVAAAAASVSAPAPRRSASAAASAAAAQGNQAVGPAGTKAAPPKAAEEAANGAIPPDIAALAAKLAAGPPLKGVALQCANLLKLATSLKTAVASTTKDELSVPVVRDAGQIEEMARKMREEQQH
jgi:hypothetical protein